MTFTPVLITKKSYQTKKNLKEIEQRNKNEERKGLTHLGFDERGKEFIKRKPMFYCKHQKIMAL